MNTDPVLTPAARAELTELVDYADELAAWLRRHPQRAPFPTPEQRARSVPYADTWTASFTMTVNLREQWAYSRNLFVVEDGPDIWRDVRVAMSGVLSDRYHYRGRFVPYNLRHGRKMQPPQQRDRHAATWSICDNFRAISTAGRASPFCCVLHTTTPEDAEAVARDELELRAERLAFSWWHPREYTAVAVTVAGLPAPSGA